ncbi:MAG: tetratricopeptide repeat protein [bacterium]|nr:tetratricopeptide repeat protein [bacterium]
MQSPKSLQSTSTNTPDKWNPEADHLWKSGKKQAAISLVLKSINESQGPRPPRHPGMQFCYYLFLLNDYASAEKYLKILSEAYEDDAEIIENYAVILSRLKKNWPEVVRLLQRVIELKPESINAWDGLTNALRMTGDFDAAAHAGTRALQMKEVAATPPQGWELPSMNPQQYDQRRNGIDVIAFSLFGKHPRYLRGALRNTLLTPDLYPGWTVRFYLDESVPGTLVTMLSDQGAEIVHMPNGQTMRQKLGWRFAVANDPAVRRFAVRDVDSVISYREARAVEDWTISDRWFHVMRDWWTHTELILAGMWGGRAGVLPDLTEMLIRYQPAAKETPNVDQWFLREKVWGYVRQSCFTHDRFFNLPETKRWPTGDPPGTLHVGQDEFTANRTHQEQQLGPWLDRISK